jgi:DNA repair ATPase RecN
MGGREREVFTKLGIRDFQSIKSLDLELGQFTVFVGPSNSGKSAILRAMKSVARNVGSPAYVRHGAKQFSATLEGEGSTVTVERGKSQSTYRVLKDGKEDIYLKSGRTVPVEVQTALNLPLPEGPDLVFSTQIDPPFLLTETGSVSAKVLGDLTGVSKLQEAVKEGNRQRLESSRLAKIRQSDFVDTSNKLKEDFGNLQSQIDSMAKVREALASLTGDAERRDLLARLRTKYLDSRTVVAQLSAQLEGSATPPALLQEIAQLEAKVRKTTELRAARQVLTDSSLSVRRLQQALADEKAVVEESKLAYQKVLDDAGVCPWCGSEVHAK